MTIRLPSATTIDLRSEGDISKEIMAGLRAMGVYCFRVQSGQVKVRGAVMRLAPAGTPDIVCCLTGGVFLGLETKRPVKAAKQSPDQIAAQATIERAGGRYAVVRSLDDALVACGLRRPTG